MDKKIIYLASDHAGLSLKAEIIKFLLKNNLEFLDLGCYTDSSVDYPDYAKKLAQNIKENPLSKGVLICGSGIGMSIAANRCNHIRAALCITPEMAELARKHNDANVLVLGARLISKNIAISCLKAFIDTNFSKDQRHINRINKLSIGE